MHNHVPFCVCIRTQEQEFRKLDKIVSSSSGIIKIIEGFGALVHNLLECKLPNMLL